MNHEAVARINAQIVRCEMRTTELLARLSALFPWEDEAGLIRAELTTQELMLRTLHAHRRQLLAIRS